MPSKISQSVAIICMKLLAAFCPSNIGVSPG
jgi:hypothetical protein